MKATSIYSPETRIIPASRAHKDNAVRKQADGAMEITFGNGRQGRLGPEDIDLQAFVVWTMLSETTHV